MSSILGRIFRVTTFGESHGAAIGVVIDGCPPDIHIDQDLITKELQRRKPGQSEITSPRKEPDTLTILSGIFRNKTIGSPICMVIYNKDQRSKDYQKWKDVFRPSHADFSYQTKYNHRFFHGGGRASARETIGRVAAGALAQQILYQELNITTLAWVEQIGKLRANISTEYDTGNIHPQQIRKEIESSIVRCPEPKASGEMIQLIKQAQKNGDSLGGIVRAVVFYTPPGLGEPVFDKLEAELAKACLSIPACKGFEVGSGFSGAQMNGSEHNDSFVVANRDQIKDEKFSLHQVRTDSNHSGGIQGGISNGMPITMRLAFKPTATIQRHQQTVDLYGHNQTLRPGGRHDPCVLPRAVVIVEAMINLVLVDFYLLQRAQNPKWQQFIEQQRKQRTSSSE